MSTSPSPCSFFRVSSYLYSCNSYECSIHDIHVDLYESELTRKLVAIFIHHDKNYILDLDLF